MQANFEKLQFIIGSEKTIKNMVNLNPLKPFSENVIDFLNALSKNLLRNSKGFSDVATFGFWCRKAALLQEKKNYNDLNFRLGRGIVFHSAPSNVPVNFAFSFASGLLAGNANIIRLPSKNFEQVEIICRCIRDLLNSEFLELSNYICMVKYPPEKDITDYLSSICDTRVIWGGDNTIGEIRKSPLKARSNEITFADRFSIAVINADEYLSFDNKKKVANDFYNDTFYSDQNACTSPMIIVWLGVHKETAKREFWNNINNLAKEKYNLTPIQSVGKLAEFFKVSINYDIKLLKNENQLITRIQIDNLSENLKNYKYNSGFFFEYDAKELKEILPICDNKCQTLTYFGLKQEKIKSFFQTYRPCGIDRVVPIGKSMDFTLVWDGYDLIRSLSRKVNVL